MDFDDEDLGADPNNNSGTVVPRRPNTSRGGGASNETARQGSAERPKTGYKTSQSRLGSAQAPPGERPQSRANSAYGGRPVTSGRMGSAVGHSGYATR